MLAPVLVASALAVALAGPPSAGEDLPLQWTAPSDCPQRDAVRHQIGEHLAREDFGDALSQVRVAGTLTGEGDTWTLTVAVTLPDGDVRRQVQGSSCQELTQAAGLIIAVALDPLRAAAQARRAAEPAPQPQPQPQPVVERTAPERPSAPTPEPHAPPQAEPFAASSPAPRRAIDLRVGPLLELGTLDTIRAGAYVSAGLVWTHVRVDLGAAWVAPRRRRPFAAEPDAGVRVQQAGGLVRACFVPGRDAVVIATCAGVEAGFMRGRGIGLTTAQTSAAPSVATTLGPELTWISRRRIGLWAAADAMFHLVRPRWSVPELGVAAQTRTVGFRVVVGPTLRL